MTLEQWSGRGQIATVWAVRSSEIVVYRVEGSEHDQLLRVVPLEKKDEEMIRRLVSEIDPKARGVIWRPRDCFDGIALRISFTGDGSLRDDRIEIENHWRPEFAELIEAISSKMQPELKITFKDLLQESGAPHGLPIQRTSIKDYYRVP